MHKHFSDEQWRNILELSQAVADFPSKAQRSYLESTGCDPDVICQVLGLVSDYDSELQPEAALPDRVGSSFGRFLIKGHLGRGGLSDVYLAQDTELQRVVALKFLLPEMIQLHGSLERVIREARTASALNHPNIVTIHEVIRSESTVAIAMEFVEGTPLRQMCGPLPLHDVLRIGKQIALALGAAHGEGIVHRDIKPENIIVKRDGSVKVLDFGLATRIERSDETEDGTDLVAGTVRYMSPEQGRGETLTAASDIYSLGLVLYEVCTGEPALANGHSAVDRQHSAQLGPLQSLILAMIAENPINRPNAAEAAELLSAIEGNSTSAAGVLGRLSKPLRYVVVVAGCLTIAIAFTSVWRFLNGRDPAFYQVTTLVSENRATAAAISPDGSLQCYANVDGIFVRSPQTGKTTELPAPTSFVADRLAWFTNGRTLVASGFSSITNKRSVWRISAEGKPPHLIRADAEAAVPSPDGQQVAFLNEDQSEIWIADARGDGARRVICGPEDDTFPFVFWSADGRRLGFQRRHYSSKTDLGHVMLDRYYERSYESVELRTGRTMASVPNLWMNSAAALPDGRVVFLRYNQPGSERSNELWEVRTDQVTGAFRGGMHQVASLIKDPGDYIYDMSATVDGSQVMVLRRSAQKTTFVADFEASPPRIFHVRRFTFDERLNFPHAWTADSKTVIFESDRGGSWDIWKQRLDQRTPESIIATPGSEVLPQLSPDGLSILYAAGPSNMTVGGFKLMRIPVQGGTPQEVPLGGPLDEFRCAVGGDRCVVRTTIGRQYFVFSELDPVRGRGRELARTPWMTEVVAAWDMSPDGSQVAFPNHSRPAGGIRVVPLDGSVQHDVLFPGVTDVSGLEWAAEGNAWFVSEATAAGNQMLYVGLDGQISPLGNIQGWAVPSPDGHKLAFQDSLVATNAWMIDRR